MADVTANGVRMHVQRLGAGPPTVVFLHGLVMDNLSSFYFTLANPVAQRAEAVLYDLRGHGRSERPRQGYALADFHADLTQLISALRIEGPVHLVGNSFGGLLALDFAAAQSTRVSSVVLIDGHLGMAGWGEAMAETLGLRGTERDQRIAESFRHWLGRHSERKRSRLATSARALVEDTTMVEDLRLSPQLSTDSLRSLACPVLALYGEQSDLRPQAHILEGLVPGAKLIIHPGSTHSLLWEATPWVREQILGWLAEQA